jgi:hypothetical protein
VRADAATLRQTLRADPSGFALTALEAARTGRLVLVVDQFEQLFTLCADEAERRAFIAALHAAATTGHGQRQVPAAAVILVVRADFEARCADYAELTEAVQARYLLPRMTELQLRLAITEPARVAGSAVDGALTAELVRAVGAVADGARVLPHLSHALDQAWRNRAGGDLTLADYERAGGIEGSIAESADRAYMSLTSSQREAARQVFTRLTATSADGADTADRASRAELAEGKSPAEVTDVDAVLEAFAAKRLLTLAADTVELSHEALLTAWPLLRDTWLAETHADRVTRTRLRKAADDWAGNDHDPSYLYRGSLLEAANGIAARISARPARNPHPGQPDLNTVEQAFLAASQSEALASRRAREHAVRLRRVLTAVLVILLIGSASATGVALHNAADARAEQIVALSRQLATEGLALDAADPLVARQLTVAAWRVSPTPEAGTAMLTLVTEQQQKGELPTPALGNANQSVGLAMSLRRGILVSTDDAGDVMALDAATGAPLGPPHQFNPGALSSDGRLLATSYDQGLPAVQLRDPVTGAAVGRPIPVGLRGSVQEMWFSPDGRLLATGGNDGYVRLWDPATGQPVGVQLPAAGEHAGLVSPITFPLYSLVTGVAFSPDGRLLLSVTGGSLQAWPVWPFADPYAALCAQVGPPSPATWSKYAPGHPQPGICATRSSATR